MVTPEERITRLEAIQEANTQQLALVLSRLDQVVNQIEAARQEAREMNEAARQEAREDTRALRRETHQLVEAARRESRIFFLSLIAIGAGVLGTVIGTSLAG